MTCETMEMSLVAYLDGRSSPAERRQVEAHLTQCAACRMRAEEFRVLWSALDELPMVMPSAGFDAAVRRRVAAEPSSRWRSWLTPSPRMAFAVAALMLLAVWLTSMPPARAPETESGGLITAQVRGNESEFTVIKDLPVLEDYDVLSNFDALSELPVQAAAPATQPRL